MIMTDAMASRVGDVPWPSIMIGMTKNTTIRKAEIRDNVRRTKVIENPNDAVEKVSS
jgi:hypothetical protein